MPDDNFEAAVQVILVTLKSTRTLAETLQAQAIAQALSVADLLRHSDGAGDAS